MCTIKTEAAQHALLMVQRSFKAIPGMDSNCRMMKLSGDLQREIRNLKRNRNGRNVKIQCWNCVEDVNI